MRRVTPLLMRWLMVLLTGFGFSAEAQTPGLALRLTMAGRAFKMSEHITARIMIENAGVAYVVLHPHLLFDIPCPSMGPFPVINLEVRDSSGRVVAHQHRLTSDGERVVTPQPASFLIMAPGFFYGADIDLSAGQFSFRPPHPGKYTLRLSLCTSARSWLLRRLSDRQVDKAEVQFDLERVAEGQIASETATVLVSPDE